MICGVLKTSQLSADLGFPNGRRVAKRILKKSAIMQRSRFIIGKWSFKLTCRCLAQFDCHYPTFQTTRTRGKNSVSAHYGRGRLQGKSMCRRDHHIEDQSNWLIRRRPRRWQDQYSHFGQAPEGTPICVLTNQPRRPVIIRTWKQANVQGKCPYIPTNFLSSPYDLGINLREILLTCREIECITIPCQWLWRTFIPCYTYLDLSWILINLTLDLEKG